jgi:hypothetical protein
MRFRLSNGWKKRAPCRILHQHRSAQRPRSLESLPTIVECSHDEYWSKEMRDNVEAFVKNGGNVVVFSGNICWWQVRFEDDDRTMVSYRSAEEDPMNGVNNSRVTTNWRDAPVSRPENQMTGVSFNHGGGWYDPTTGPRPAVGYCVQLSQHWFFAETGLNNNGEFGKENLIVGYEADGAEFSEQAGVRRLTEQDGTLANFVILATADLSGWAKGTNWAGYDNKGCATMGMYQENGVVFTAATTDWVWSLNALNPVVSQITLNVLQRRQQVASSGVGIDGYDLASTADRAIAFDYDSSGKLDHLVLYRSGTSTIWILKNGSGTFSPVYTSGPRTSGSGAMI